MKVKSLSTFLFISFIFIYSLIFTASANAAAQFPFPINRNYSYGVRASSVNHATIQNMYNTWRATYVTSSGVGGTCTSCLRVQSPEAIWSGGTAYYGATVSEGIGYGMLLAVYLNDQTTFDGLWRYCVNKTGAKTTGLMPWVINSAGTILDTNSATDADEDIAFALLMADRQWGSGGTFNYLALGTTMINNIRSYDISGTDYHPKPGDAWDDWSYPSYYTPAWYREFALVDTAHAAFWNSVIAKVQSNTTTNRNTTYGLVGEVCTSTGARMTNNPCGSAGCDGRLYKYNSCRVPWRWAADYIWNGDAYAQGESTLLSNFFIGITANGIKDGYWISNGTSDGGPNHNASFTGPAGCAVMTSTQANIDNFYQAVVSFNVTESYYNGSLQLLSLLMMAGDFHNLRQLAPVPTPTDTPVPSTVMLDDFEDNNNLNNWSGYWYTYQAGTGATVWPIQGQICSPTAGGATGTAYAMHMTGTVGVQAPTYPCIGVGTNLAPLSYTAVDISGFSGIKFWAKSSAAKSYAIRFNAPKWVTQTGDNDYKFVFTPPATWTQYTIAMTDLTQEPSWGIPCVRTYILQRIINIAFQTYFYSDVPVGSGPAVDLWVDQIEFYPNLNWTPTPNPTKTNTLTPTRTVTVTQTPTFGPSELLDDCEDNNSVNNWGGVWYTYNDSANLGTSYVVPIPGSAFTMYGPAQGAAGTQYAARITGFVTDVYSYGFAGMGTATNPFGGSGTGINLNTTLGIRFWAKGNDANYSVKLIPGTTTVDGGNNYKMTFFASSTWTQYQLFFSEFTQEAGWGTAVALSSVKSNLAAFNWQTIGQPWANMELVIDQIEVFPQMVWTRTYTPSPTRTITPTPTRSYTVSPTPTYTRTPLPSTATFTGTPTGTSTRTATGTFTRTNTPTFTNTPLPTNTNSPTRSSTPTGTPTFTATNTPILSPTYTRTPTFTRTGTPTGTSTATPSPTFTVTPTRTGTPTGTGTYTPPPTATYTSTRTGTPTGTSTYTPPPTSTYTPTRTGTPTGTSTYTPPPTSTYTSTRTGTPTGTGTYTPTPTSTYTATRTGTPTYTRTATSTYSRTMTFTSTSTRTSTATLSATASASPSPTYTRTPTNTPSPTISNTWTPGFGTLTNTPTITQTWTNSASPTRTATPTFSSTVTGTFTRTPTPTFTSTGTGTFTRTITPVFTNTASPTTTNSPQGTLTNTPTFTLTSTRTPTGTYTNVPTGTFTRTPTPVPTNTASPTISNTAQGTFTNTPTVTSTPTRTATGTFTNMPTGTYTRTGTSTFTATATSSYTRTPTFTRTASPTFTVTETNTLLPTITDTWTPGFGTMTNTPTRTVSPTSSRTQTVSPTSTRTETADISPTFTRTATYTATATFTRTASSTTSSTAVLTGTPTLTATPTRTSDETGTATYTNTTGPSGTNTPDNTATRTPTVTNTMAQSSTFTPTITRTGSATASMSQTHTNTRTWTPTFTVTETATLVPGGSLIADIAAPAISVVGGQVTVFMNVSNNGIIAIDNISPSSLAINVPASLALYSGPSPASMASLASGAGATFTWVYDVVSAAPGVTLSGSADGFNSITFAPVSSGIAVNAAPGMDCMNPTPTFTATMTATPTFTATDTPTHTRTVTPTSQISTQTATPTSTKTPETQAITNLKPYPNPLDPNSRPEVYFGFTINQRDIDRIGIRIYTAAARLIREQPYEAPAITTILNNGRIRYTTDNLLRLANGTYFYYLYVVKNSVETRSKVDKIVILK